MSSDPSKIAFVVPYFGHWPAWFPAFLHSCQSNSTVDWLFFTDCDPPPTQYANVKFFPSRLSEVETLFRERTGTPLVLQRAYRICDLKPAFGLMYEEYLQDYDFWGHCDIDIIWGDIRKHASTELLKDYDVFSTRKEAISGHFTLYRNTEQLNSLFISHPNLAGLLRKQDRRWSLDELLMTPLVQRQAQLSRLRVYWPDYLINYAKPRTSTPSRLPLYVDKYYWEQGKLYDCTSEDPAEILYLHFMNWKRYLKSCNVTYREKPRKFFVSYTHISKAD